MTGSAGSAGSAGATGQLDSECVPPDSVPDPWVVTFFPYDMETGESVSDAWFVVRHNDGTMLGAGSSKQLGSVRLSIPTGGKPIDGYFLASKAGYLPTRFRIQGGLGWFETWHTMMSTEAYADTQVATHWPGETRDPSKAIAFFGILDCNRGNEAWGLNGSTIEIEPDGLEFDYLGGTSGTSWTGFALSANIRAGNKVITVATEGSQTTYTRGMLPNTWEALILYPTAERKCHPADTSTYVPEWKPPVALAQGLCTDQQAKEYAASCWFTARPYACERWRTDSGNSACYACAVGHESDATRTAFVHFEHLGLYDRDEGACVSALEGDLTSASCGAKVQAANACSRFACSACPIQPETFDADTYRLNGCLSEAAESECKTYWDAAKACSDDLLGNGEPVDQCIWDAAEAFSTMAERYVKVFCGDGGA